MTDFINDYDCLSYSQSALQASIIKAAGRFHKCDTTNDNNALFVTVFNALDEFEAINRPYIKGTKLDTDFAQAFSFIMTMLDEVNNKTTRTMCPGIDDRA